MLESFASLLCRFRARSRMTVADLAEALGATYKSIAAWEQGRRVPRDRARILDMAQVLRLTLVETDQLVDAARRFKNADDGARDNRGQPSHASLDLAPGKRMVTAMLHQLRPPVADFVGRAQEMTQLVTAFQSAAVPEGSAVISGIQGMGGIGKTELAYQVAHQLRGMFPDAQIVLDLRGSSSAPLPVEQAIQMIIRDFVQSEQLPNDVHKLQQLYRSVLHQQQVLILADDARDAAQVRLLCPPPGCGLLVTSRQRFTLPGMISIDLEQLSPDEAVALLSNICPRLSAEDGRAIARTCGYLPQALRVSGGILRNNPAIFVADYLTRLGDARQRLAQLRDPDDPQMDVEASLALSYAMLPEPAQRVFRHLGVFVADFATELAQAVSMDEPGQDVTALLHLLLRRNLIMYDSLRDRWRLHDLVRDLAWQYLHMEEEWAAAMERYAQAVLAMTHEIEQHYRAGGNAVALERFDAEYVHIETVRGWLVAQAGSSTGDMLLVAEVLVTRAFDELRGDPQARLPQLEQALAAARRSGDRRGEAGVLWSMGIAYRKLGDYRPSIPCIEQQLKIAREIGDRHSEGAALCHLGGVYWALGNYQRSITYHKQALRIARALDNQRDEFLSLTYLGVDYRDMGNYQRSITYHKQALRIARALDNQRDKALALNHLGLAYSTWVQTRQRLHSFQQCFGRAWAAEDQSGVAQALFIPFDEDRKKLRQATAYHKQALAIFQALGDRRFECFTLTNLGLAALLQDDSSWALQISTQALAIARAIGDRRREGYALSYLGLAYLSQRAWLDATRHYEQALACLQALGDRSGVAECHWYLAVAWAQQGEWGRTVRLLHDWVAYACEIRDPDAAKYAALLARLETGEPPLAERRYGSAQDIG
jgi:tetratricopeptide (TPR) repeat protein/transcriptional regulator with XRE-family HTH domain